MTFNTIGGFLSERLLFSHEASAGICFFESKTLFFPFNSCFYSLSGLYYTSAFYVAHSVLSFLLSIPLMGMTSAIMYFLIDFPSEGFNFFILFCFAKDSPKKKKKQV